VGSALGVSEEKILALPEYATSPLYDDAERAALEYADAITRSDLDVDDELFARLRGFYDDDAVVELTAIIAWENASSKFNRALRVPSQGLWRRARPEADRPDAPAAGPR
jgi:alkylhydroperoxidase family enzyme